MESHQFSNAWFKLGQIKRVAVAMFAAALCLGGCSESQPTTEAPNERESRLALENINLLIVGDEQIGPVIKRQWAARRDGEMEIRNITVGELADSEYQLASETDVVIYPPALIGEFVSRNQLAEVPANVWNDVDYLNKKELLRHARSTLVNFSKTTWAVPLGSPQFVMLYRDDVLNLLETQPPVTWDEFDDLAARLNDTQTLADEKGNSIPTGIGLPLSDEWAAQLLLARAAAYVRYRGKLSTVFDRQNMNPLIGSEPFVRALSELQNICPSNDQEPWRNPREVYAEMIKGNLAVAITWPATENDESNEVAANDSIKIARLPGSKNWFDTSGKGWTERPETETPHVELMGFDGLVASINRKSGRSITAQELLKWLPSKSISLATVAGSSHSGPFRASHLGNPSRWTGDGISTIAAMQYADVIRQVNDEAIVFMFPRIPGRTEYLKALDAAVTRCLAGEIEPEAALKSAAQQWNKITDKYGRTAQRANLRRGEGI